MFGEYVMLKLESAKNNYKSCFVNTYTRKILVHYRDCNWNRVSCNDTNSSSQRKLQVKFVQNFASTTAPKQTVKRSTKCHIDGGWRRGDKHHCFEAGLLNSKRWNTPISCKNSRRVSFYACQFSESLLHASRTYLCCCLLKSEGQKTCQSINQSINQSKPVTPRRRWGTPTDASALMVAHRRLPSTTWSNDDID